MADLHEVVFRQAGHFNDVIAVDIVLQQGTGNFQLSFLNTLLLKLQ